MSCPREARLLATMGVQKVVSFEKKSGKSLARAESQGMRHRAKLLMLLYCDDTAG
jgi:hypothetical protein